VFIPIVIPGRCEVSNPESRATTSGFRVRSRGPPRNDGFALSELGNLRPRRLMHRRVPGIRDPGLLIDKGQPPDRAPGARIVIEPRHRAIVDVEGQALLDQPAERERNRSPDRAAMGGGDDVPARMFARDTIDRGSGAMIEVHEALATGRGLADIGEPA